MKAQILSLLFLAIGFGAGYQWSNMKTQNSQLKPTVAHDEKDFYKTKYETLTTKFQALSDQEIESYINESDPSLKGSKADAMLTKLMKLFLVDIGLRLSEQNKRFQDSKFKYSSVTQKTETAKKFEKPVCEYTKQTCEERFGKITEKVAQINWQNKELGLASVNSVSQMSDFLKDVEVPNLFNYLSSAKVIDQNSYKFFSGNFEGELTFDNKKKKNSLLKLQSKI